MAYKSKYTGAQVDSLLDRINGYPEDPQDILNDLTITKEQITNVLTGADIMGMLTGQQIIDKINSVTGNITFTKYVDCQAGAGKSTN